MKSLLYKYLFYYHSKTQPKHPFKIQNVPMSIQELMLRYCATAMLLALLRRIN